MSTTPLRRNFIVNLLSPMTRIVVALVTVPLYLHHIGDARYGVMSIVWVLLGYFGFLDLGLSRAVTNALAKLRDAPQPHRARVLLTTFGLNLGIGLMGGLVLYVFGGLLLRHFVSMPEEISAGSVSVASLDRLPSAAHAYFSRRRGRPGEPGTLPAREFDPGFRSDACSGCAGRRGGIRQSVPYGRHTHSGDSSGVGCDRGSGGRASFGRAILTSCNRLGGSAEVARLWRVDVRHEHGLSCPRLRGSIHHRVGDGRGVGRSLCSADEPCPTERFHPGGVRAHPLSPYVQPAQRCSPRAGNARALNDGLWVCRHLCSGDDPLVDLLSLLDRRRFRDSRGACGSSAIPGDVDGGPILSRFHPPAKSGQGQRNGQTEYHRVCAICGHSLGVDPVFRDCWRSHCLELAVRSRCIGDALAFRHEEKGPSRFVASSRAFGHRPCYISLPGLHHARKFRGGGVHRGRGIRNRLPVFRRVAQADSWRRLTGCAVSSAISRLEPSLFRTSTRKCKK